jgi:hypothetical protein
MRYGTFSIAVLVASLASVAAYGQPSDAAKAEALRRYDEGIDLYDKKDDEGAYVKFSQAYAVVKAPKILFNLARTEQLTGRVLDAAQHFRDYLAIASDPNVTEDSRAQVRGFLADVRTKLGAITIDAPAGATIRIDGKPLPELAPLHEPIDVLPGAHTIAASMGDKNAETKITASAGAASSVHLELEAGAVIVPQTSPAPPTTQTTRTPDATSTPASSSARTVVTIAALGVGIVGLGVGTGFMFAARSKADDLAAYQNAHPGTCAAGSTACAEGQSLLDDRSSSQTISAIGFVAGGIGVIGAAAAWFFWPQASPSANTAWIAPSASPAAWGLRLGGSF